jgi:hypothetical protein
MLWKAKGYKKTVTEELAEAIASFNLERVMSLLSDSGCFPVPGADPGVGGSEKEMFSKWLEKCYTGLSRPGKKQRNLGFTIVQSMHSKTGSSILLFEDGKFPRLSPTQAPEEKSGLVIRTENGMVTGIEFCFLVLKTESPFIYERRYLR